MGFNISEIVQGSGWKNFMKYLYGWGASIVILGALFKILHLPGAATMLMFGMGIEAIIFFFSAFEPIHEEVDWTLVYPELAGMSDEEELRKYRSDSKHGGPLDADAIKEIISSVVATGGGGQAVSSSGQAQQVSANIGGALVFTEKFNKMLENAEIGPELFDKVGKGLSKLGETSTKLADISNAAVATNEYTDKMKKASESIGTFTESYSKSGQVLNESINILSPYAGRCQAGLLFLYKNNHPAYKADIQLGRQNPDYYEVLGGLQSGDKVVVSSYENYGKMQELVLKK